MNGSDSAEQPYRAGSSTDCGSATRQTKDAVVDLERQPLDLVVIDREAEGERTIAAQDAPHEGAGGPSPGARAWRSCSLELLSAELRAVFHRKLQELDEQGEVRHPGIIVGPC